MNILEPGAEMVDSDDIVLASIAISLKRIADTLEKLPGIRRVVEYHPDGTIKRVELVS